MTDLDEKWLIGSDAAQQCEPTAEEESVIITMLSTKLCIQFRIQTCQITCWRRKMVEQYLGHLDSIFSQCGQPYLSSTGLVLDVVDGADLGAHVLQVGSGSVDGARVSRSAGHWGFLLQRGLLGNWGFGDDAAAMWGLTVGWSGWSGGCGGGEGSTGWTEKEVCGWLLLFKNFLIWHILGTRT